MSRGRQVALLTAVLAPLVSLAAGQDPGPATQNPPASQDQDAAAKAAARKKRFEEMKKQLENQGAQPAAQPQSQTQQTASKTGGQACDNEIGDSGLLYSGCHAG